MQHYWISYAVRCMQSNKNVIYHQLSVIDNVTRVVLAHILDKEERDEKIINLKFAKKNKEISSQFVYSYL